MLNHHPRLDAYWDRVCVLEVEPISVQCTTLTPVAMTDPLHLDSILSSAVVLQIFEGLPLPQSSTPYFLPIPLAVESWFDELPLWQSTDLVPVNPLEDRTHIHQRTDANPYRLLAHSVQGKKRKQIPKSEGQYMSYRLPLRTVWADRWQARCVGNLEEVRSLLELLTHVGRKTHIGFGRVANWQVESCKNFELCERPIPIATAEDILQHNASFMGWTPPYWNRTTWRMCRGNYAAS